jgi:DnaJ-domain-containing protein 1
MSSLEASLSSIARRWEQERAQESNTLRRTLADANRRASAEAEKLRAEKAKTANLEQRLKESESKVAAEKAKSSMAEDEKTRAGLQALGCFLIIAELRAKLKALSTVDVDKEVLSAVAALEGGGSATAGVSGDPDAASVISVAASPSRADDDDDDDGDDDDNDDEGDGSGTGTGTENGAEGGEHEGDHGDGSGELPAGGLTRTQKRRQKRKEKKGSVVGTGTSTPGKGAADLPSAPATTVERSGQSASSAASSRQLAAMRAACAAAREVMDILPEGGEHSVTAADLLDACREGRVRSVESFFSQRSLRDAVEAHAQNALVASLEMSVLEGRGSIVKTLIDGGADAHRTEALHLAIRHGHVSILNHLVSVISMSVNAVDANGQTPLHVAAAANQPKAAQFLLKQCASIDALDADGKSALDIATEQRWKEMQRVLRDPGTLFWNRCSRATRLYKAQEYELACEAYEAALKEKDRMVNQRVTPENLATLYFNFGRAAQSSSSLTRAVELFTLVLESVDSHERALEHRADCLESLGDLQGAINDINELKASYGAVADASARKRWNDRSAALSTKTQTAAHALLGVDRNATSAQIRKAYRQLCLQYHPDKHASSSDDARTRAKHKFARIQDAYEKLTSSPFGRSGGFGGGGFGGGGFDFGQRAAPPSRGGASWSGHDPWGANSDEGESDGEDDDDDDDEEESNQYSSRW